MSPRKEDGQASPKRGNLLWAGLIGLSILLFSAPLLAAGIAVRESRGGEAGVLRTAAGKSGIGLASLKSAANKAQDKAGGGSGSARDPGASVYGIPASAERGADGVSTGLAAILAERARARALAQRLTPEAVSELSLEDTASLAQELGRALRLGGLEPEDILEAILPSPEASSALLASDRDLEDFRKAESGEGEAARHYGGMAELVLPMRALRPRYEALLGAVYGALKESRPRESLVGPIAAPREIYVPSRRNLDRTHPYALDVFFISVERFAGGIERGPELLSVSPGIVLATASDWRGGPGWSTYEGGGFSPNSGNGAIVYDPTTRRFYAYFHLSELSVRTGEIIETGTVLGRGGDTGSNARKDGHGGHVHVEVFDAIRGKPLKALEIRDLLFSR